MIAEKQSALLKWLPLHIASGAFTFFVISSNINKVTILPADRYFVNAGYIPTIVKYKKLLFALAFTELAVRVYGIGAVCGK